MAIHLPNRFKLAEVREVACPFVEEWVFSIRPTSYGPYQKWLEANSAAMDAAGAPFVRAEIKANARAEAQVRGLKEGPEREAKRAEAFDKALDAEYEELNVEVEGFMDAMTVPCEGVALLVGCIKGVREVPDGPICDPDDPDLAFVAGKGSEPDGGVLALSDPLPVSYVTDDLEVQSGTPLGLAIRMWVLAVAADLDKFRDEQLEDAAKN